MTDGHTMVFDNIWNIQVSFTLAIEIGAGQWMNNDRQDLACCRNISVFRNTNQVICDNPR